MRRSFLLAVIATAILMVDLTAQDTPLRRGDVFPRWRGGYLDIHQIVTGRGNAAFSIFPDGTTMLVDAGDASVAPDAPQRPGASRTPGQWIARYIRAVSGAAEPRIDYAVLTHFHPDHIGAITGTEQVSRNGGYRLRGITEVAEDVPVHRIVDRGWPDYSYLPPPRDLMFENYQRFVTGQTAAKQLTMIGAQAGSTAQIVALRKPDPAFSVRIVSVNDRVWTGEGEQNKVRFPSLDTIALADDRPTENMSSVTLRIKYGEFDYFTGGDMPGYPVPGAPAWHDLESDVARAIGPTDVHVVNHHGSIEEENPFWLATLRSRVMIVPAWSPTHPSPDVLKRMLSRRVYPEPRDVFITVFRDATKSTIGARAQQVASDHGHVVIRVEPGGRRYWVAVLDDLAESYRITSVHGPYESQP